MTEMINRREPWPYADRGSYECEECGNTYCYEEHLGGPWWETTCTECGHVEREYQDD